MDTGPRIDSYEWAGGREPMLRFGPEYGPVVVLALPLFEEANRTRAFGVSILRALAARGIGGVLPEMPGQGESLTPLDGLSLLRIQEGYEGVIDPFWAADQRAYGIGIRSGALLDALGLLDGRWYLSPQSGPALKRQLHRLKELATERRLSELCYFDGDLPEEAPVEVAGNLISTSLLTDLQVKEPWTPGDGGPVRVVRLHTDSGQADRHVEGAPPWRRAEPDNDPALAETLAADIAHWIAACES